MKSKAPFDADFQVRAMLERGWTWRDPFSSVLVHPQDHSLYAVYDSVAGTLGYSAALCKALELIIPTPSSENPYYWPDDQRAHTLKKKSRVSES